MSGRTIEIKSTESDRGKRLDAFVASAVDGISRTRVGALIEEGRVTVDGAPSKPSYRLKGAESVVVHEPEPEASENLPEEMHLEILYEDSDLVAVNKPAGLVVHPAAGNLTGTLVNALLAHSSDLSGIGGVARPGIVHRLDKGTSGAIICAKNDFAHESLSNQFAGRTVEKIYLCVTLGAPSPKKGLIDRSIGRHPVQRKKMAVDVPGGRTAKTEYEVLAAGGGIACVRCRLLTGRTHQIRVHLKSLGAPLLMDETYGGVKDMRSLPAKTQAAIGGLDRPALHAWTLAFDHPRTGVRIRLKAPVPDDLRRCLGYLGIEV